MVEIHERERRPNPLLTRQRELRGWSQGQVAKELQALFPGIAVTAKHVARWESGKRRPGPYYREKLCALFQTTADKLGFIPQDAFFEQHGEEGKTAQKEERQNSSSEAQTATPNIEDGTGEKALPSITLQTSETDDLARQSKTQNGIIQVVIITTPYSLDTSPKNGLPSSSNVKFEDITAAISEIGEQTLDIPRRQLLRSLLNAACTRLVLSPYTSLCSDTIERLKKNVENYWSADTLLLDDLEVATQRYWNLSKNISFEVFDSVVGHFQTVTHLLKRSQPTNITLRLHLIASETAQILGKILFDIHEYELAWEYYSFAISAAQTAKIPALSAVGFGRMSLLSMSSNKYQEALTLLEEGHKFGIQDTRIQGWLSIVESEAYSYLQNIESFTRSAEIAEKFITETNLGEDIYFTGFNLSRLEGYKGSCYIRFNKIDLAITSLQKAYTLLDPSSIRRKSVILAHMGTAHARVGDIKSACECANQALAITTQTHSIDTLQRIYALRLALGQVTDNALIQDLDQHIRVVYQQIKSVQADSLP